MRPIHTYPVFPALLFAAALGVCTPPAFAGSHEYEVVLRHGRSSSGNYERTGLGLRFSPLWTRQWENWDATLRPAIELARFRYTGSHSGRSRLEQAGAIGLLRLQKREGSVRPYAEIGLGAALFSGNRLGRKDISTNFQFSQHLGMGFEFTGGWNLGLQYSHYSNAGIKNPNHGFDLYQLLLGRRF